MTDALKDKVVIVTGSSRGIGKAIAREGAKVVVSGRSSGSSGGALTIDETAKAIQAEGGEALAVRCDVTSEADVRDLVRLTRERYGRIDILVNNAGVLWPRGLMDTPFAKWTEIMRTNIDGVYLCTMAVLPGMIEQGSGSIVNISSGRAYSEDARSTAYAASKAAVDRLTIKLATEIKSHNIAVNAIDPGATLTELSQTNYPELDKSAWKTTEEKNIIDACLFLAVQGADYSGKVLKESEYGVSWPEGRTS